MKKRIKAGRGKPCESVVYVAGKSEFRDVAIQIKSVWFGRMEYAWAFPTPTQARRIAAALLKAADEAERKGK